MLLYFSSNKICLVKHIICGLFSIYLFYKVLTGSLHRTVLFLNSKKKLLCHDVLTASGQTVVISKSCFTLSHNISVALTVEQRTNNTKVMNAIPSESYQMYKLL